MIFINETSRGTVYRIDALVKSDFSAGVSEVLLSDNADKTIVAAGIKALYGTLSFYNS